jgi:hypothetical protein
VKNSEININNVKYTINDFSLDSKKILVCGRGESIHPEFHPRFSTPTTNIDSELYITVDHDPRYAQYVTKKGNYALSLIVDPKVPEKILELGGKIFWFSPEFINLGITQITCGQFPRGNSGLASIMLASFLGAKHILISGIKLDGQYSQFMSGKKIVFDLVKKNKTNLYSMDGILCEKITYQQWCEL